MSLLHRASVIPLSPVQAFRSTSGVRAVDFIGVPDAKILKPSASHGAAARSPARRSIPVGARRLGV